MDRPNMTRRSHQKVLQRRKRQLRKRRQDRIRRIRMIRTLRSARFWARSGVAALIFFFVVFWAKFAYVYDIPTYAQRGALTNASGYITAKPWWFGPPVFDLQTYAPDAYNSDLYHQDPLSSLVSNLGKYHGVLDQLDVLWVNRTHP